MYSTCLFCSGPLGTNAVIEAFPVGRRLAFDAARGRLAVLLGGSGMGGYFVWQAWEALSNRVRRQRFVPPKVMSSS